MTNLTTSLAETINTEYRLANENAKSAVTHAINCGKALIEAKKQCKHGEWLSWLEENVTFSRQTVDNYVKLANCQRDSNLENAPSIREALKLLDEPKQKKATAVFINTDAEGTDTNNKKRKAKTSNAPSVDDDMVAVLTKEGISEEAIAERLGTTRRAVVCSHARIAREQLRNEGEKSAEVADAAKQELSLTAQQKLDKAIALFEHQKLTEMQQQFQVELQAAIQREQDRINEARKELIELEKKLSKAATTITTIITYDEFKMIRGCLHPDRQPDELKEKFGKAFDLFNRLEQHVNIKAPIDFLRRYGWEEKSPYYRGRKS